ncbi:MAG: hypothetical protein K8S16_01910, partial [Bacteroidales bacterium]|nr:hypothetical protein [Bacteroidales bacterium]
MFNFLVSYGEESWNSSPAEFQRTRVAVEYTANEISERYKFLDEQAIEELKSFPSLFVTEDEVTESRIGYISDIRLRPSTVVFEFEFDPILPPLSCGTISSIGVDINLGSWELSRTHWAIKDEPLFEILIRKGILSIEQVEASQKLRSNTFPDPAPILSK